MRRSKRAKRVETRCLVMALTVLVAGTGAMASDEGASDEEARGGADGRRFSIRVEYPLTSYASGTGGWSDLMRQGGFDDSRENIFGSSRDSLFGGPPASYPREDGIYLARSALCLAYRVRSRWSVTFMVETGRSSQPSVEGYSGPFAALDFQSPRAYIRAEQTMRSWAGLVSFLPTPGVRLGAGFSVSSVASSYTSRGLTLQRFEATRPGLVLDGGLELPAGTRFFVDLGVQFRVVAPLDVGSVTVQDDGAYVGTIPEGTVSFSHSRITIGLGLRL